MYYTCYMIFALAINPTIPADLKSLDDSQSYTCYMILVLVTNPTIPADLKSLGNDQFKVREAATARLGSLPGWTAVYFKCYVRKTTDAEVRMRCKSVYNHLAWKQIVGMHWVCTQVLLQMHAVKRRAEAIRLWQSYWTNAISNLVKLSAEDLKLVEAQKVCPFHIDVPLGATGMPQKIMLKGQPVFLCCKDCIKKAQADPNKTLAKVKELKEKPKGVLPYLTEKQYQKIRQMAKSAKNQQSQP
jgi:hypothetical protein